MALKRENCRFKEKNNNENEDPSCLTSKTNKSMEDVMTSAPCCRFGNERMKKEVCEAMLKPDFLLHDDLKRGFISLHKCEIYSARNMLKAMDSSSGALSLSGIEMLRTIEGLENENGGLCHPKGR